jgi:lipoyl-dependent peroxiredoxin
MELTMKRHGSAIWTGTLKDGRGSVSTDSGVLQNSAYSFSTRFENGYGTNPEELIAAAHAGCYNMALSARLEEAGFKAAKLETTASVYLEKLESGFTITKIHLKLEADIPGIGQEEFQEAAADAKANCPVSRLLNATITLEAKLLKNS